ncbi:hypothetical protein [Cupriavidus malaysiensis]|uniref:hypothetical protein n=1 Tax=Cupriavidus malaysiensis TaxID=367825 RepID=UPI001F47BCDC|nr:hypothetical protein [Cupriavidus malaysiensis]
MRPLPEPRHVIRQSCHRARYATGLNAQATGSVPHRQLGAVESGACNRTGHAGRRQYLGHSPHHQLQRGDLSAQVVFGCTHAGQSTGAAGAGNRTTLISSQNNRVMKRLVTQTFVGKAGAILSDC